MDKFKIESLFTAYFTINCELFLFLRKINSAVERVTAPSIRIVSVVVVAAFG